MIVACNPRGGRLAYSIGAAKDPDVEENMVKALDAKQPVTKDFCPKMIALCQHP